MMIQILVEIANLYTKVVGKRMSRVLLTLMMLVGCFAEGVVCRGIFAGIPHLYTCRYKDELNSLMYMILVGCFAQGVMCRGI